MPILRVFILGLGVLAAVFLIVSMKFSVQQWQNLQASQAEYLAAEKNVRSLSDIEKQLPAFQSYQEKIQSINASLANKAMSQTDWTTKSVVFKHSTVLRQDISGFLKGVSNKNEQWFKTKRFSLSTFGKQDDLFYWGKGSSNRLNLLLEGEYVIRRPL